MFKFNYDKENSINKDMVLDDSRLTQQTAGDNIGIITSPVKYRRLSANRHQQKAVFNVICERGERHPFFYHFTAVIQGQQAERARDLLTKNRLIFLRGDYMNSCMYVKYFRPITRFQ